MKSSYKATSGLDYGIINLQLVETYHFRAGLWDYQLAAGWDLPLQGWTMGLSTCSLLRHTTSGLGYGIINLLLVGTYHFRTGLWDYQLAAG
jgi:hypothetical protein